MLERAIYLHQVIRAERADPVGFGSSQRCHSAGFIFGSIAKGTDHANSDIDLAVVSDIDGLTLHRVVASAEADLGRSIHVSHYSKEEWRAAQEDSIVQKIVSGLKIMVIDNGSTTP